MKNILLAEIKKWIQETEAYDDLKISEAESLQGKDGEVMALVITSIKKLNDHKRFLS